MNFNKIDVKNKNIENNRVKFNFNNLINKDKEKKMNLKIYYLHIIIMDINAVVQKHNV